MSATRADGFPPILRYGTPRPWRISQSKHFRSVVLLEHDFPLPMLTADKLLSCEKNPFSSRDAGCKAGNEGHGGTRRAGTRRAWVQPSAKRSSITQSAAFPNPAGSSWGPAGKQKLTWNGGNSSSNARHLSQMQCGNKEKQSRSHLAPYGSLGNRVALKTGVAFHLCF